MFHLSPGLATDVFPSGSPTKILCVVSIAHIRATSNAHLVILDMNNLIFCKKKKELPIMQVSQSPWYFVLIF
jgi:hypothetical protein